jgi:Peptidase family M1 domain
MRLITLLVSLLLVSAWAPGQTEPQSDPQTQALLPAFQSDLSNADAWDRYQIVATLDPARQLFAGRTTLRYTNRDTQALKTLYFRLFPNLKDFAGSLNVQAVLLNAKAVPFKLEQKRYLLRIDLASPLEVGATTEIALDFRTTVPANAGRNYYGAFNLQNSVFALASAYPIIAMVRDGVWDIALPETRGDLVNSPTALYDFTLTAPVEWNLATTGSAIERNVNGRLQKVRFVSGPQRDVLIVAAKLPALRGMAGDTQVVSYYRPGEEAGGKAALQVAINAIEVFNDRFGPYPLAEFELLPVDAGTFLGVEYPGMTLIERRLYRNNPKQLETIIAHEVAHQWWYSLVGNNVQNEAWLDEALASYSQVVYDERINGAEAANAQLEAFRKTYRTARAAGRDSALALPNQRIRSYYSIVYAKGALFIHALRLQIGDEAFFSFLQSYYADKRYTIASGQDFLAHAEQACTCELDALYQDWVLSAVPVAIP